MTDRTFSAHHQATAQRDEMTALKASFDAQRETYAGLLPTKELHDAFRNAFLVAVQSNLRLLEADRQSLWLALRKCAQDRLMPDGREAALVIFGDDDEEGRPSSAKGKKKVVYMAMIAGLIKMVRNTGTIASIDTPLVYKGENVELWWEDGVRHFKFRRSFGADADDDPANIIGALAIVTHKDGGWDMEWMSRKQIDRVRAVSRAKKPGSPWDRWYDEQARKTVLRRLIKRMEKSNEMRRLEGALQADETLMTIDGASVEEAGRQIGTEFSQGEIARNAEGLRAIERETTLPRPSFLDDDPVREEVRAQAEAGGWDKPPAPPAKAAKEHKPRTTKPKPDDAREEERRQADAETGDRAGDGIIFHMTDQFGEPVLDESGIPMAWHTAKGFAVALAAELEKASEVGALIEHNLDDIGDACVDRVADDIIGKAIAAARARAARAAEQAEKPAEPEEPAAAAGELSDAGLLERFEQELNMVHTLDHLDLLRRSYEAKFTAMEQRSPAVAQAAAGAYKARRAKIAPAKSL